MHLSVTHLEKVLVTSTRYIYTSKIFFLASFKLNTNRYSWACAEPSVCQDAIDNMEWELGWTTDSLKDYTIAVIRHDTVQLIYICNNYAKLVYDIFGDVIKN